MPIQLRLLAIATLLAAVRAAEDDAEHSGHDGHDDHDDHTSRPWGLALGAAVVVNIITLLGVASLSAPSMRQGLVRAQTVTYSSGFAAGALLSACFFLMFPESIQLINTADYHAGETAEEHAGHDDRRALRALAEEEHEEHAGEISVDAIWRWGACILAGFALVVVIDLLLSALGAQASKATRLSQELGTDEDLKVDPKTEATHDEATETKTRRRVFTAVLLGDTLHNFADGVFIGTAFLTCDASVGWAVAVGTVAHEISQEIADFFLLTSVCGLRVPHALLANFLSGTTVYLGVVLVLSADLSEAGVGMILAAGGGIYLYNAAVECMPRVLHAREIKHKIVALALFAVGLVSIALVLINHEHCESE
ncbi:Zinc/iron permease [Pavlovales sp. CCMP2436]|nr:Zinc/iron permease [Pavlovales sp. CCMP2436]